MSAADGYAPGQRPGRKRIPATNRIPYPAGKTCNFNCAIRSPHPETNETYSKELNGSNSIGTGIDCQPGHPSDGIRTQVLMEAKRIYLVCTQELAWG